MTRQTHLSASERDQLARHLWAASLGVPVNRITVMFRGQAYERSMRDWRRVADAAGAWKPAPAPEHPAIKPQRAPVAPKVQLGARYEKAPPVQEIANGVAWQFCGQCDRRVTNAEAKACRSRFCKATVA